MFWPVRARTSERIWPSLSLISFFLIGEEVISKVNSLIFISSGKSRIPVMDSTARMTDSLAKTFRPRDFLNLPRRDPKSSIEDYDRFIGIVRYIKLLSPTPVTTIGLV